MMRTRVLLLATMMFLGLAAGCSKSPDAATSRDVDSNAETAAAATAVDTIAAPVAAPAADVANEAAGEDAAVDAVAESAGTDAAGKAGQQSGKALGQEIVLAANTTDQPAAANTQWQYPEGEYYSVLPTAQGTSSSPDKIEVAEIFWYGCSHCYNLEPILADWVKKLPSDVSFVRIPVMWNPVNEMHGRVYYTAEALGKLDTINPAMFRAIHIDNKPMTDEGEIRKLFEQNGVSADDFNRTFRSFSVDSKLKRAKELTVNYRVRGVPLLVIDGKYTTDGPQIHSQQELLSVASELIKRERQRS
ncbi:MAG: thiol:disulfide interchange protein DsbA/DsbL [Gammaproteobacteria bacterium]